MCRFNRAPAARPQHFARPLLVSLFAGVVLAHLIGGCPGEAGSGASVLGTLVEAAVADAPPSATNEFTATIENTAVTVTLRGQSAQNRSLTFIIASDPADGVLDPIEQVDDTSATVRFMPSEGYAGGASFTYKAWDGGSYSTPATVSISVHPEVRFSVTSSEEAGELTVETFAFTTNPKYALPEGTYAWAFDDRVVSGPMQSMQHLSHTFSDGEMHTVALTLMLAGMALPVPCRPVPETAALMLVADPNSNIAIVQSSQPVLLIRVGDSWRYLKGTANTPPADWSQRGYDDSTWLSGPTGIGYGDNDDATVLSDMANSYLTVYARRAFRIANPADVSALTLRIVYDDGFVAYLNGVEVARRNLGAPGSAVTPDAEADESIEPGPAEEIPLSTASLVAGVNVLAVEIHNSARGSSDLSFIPELRIGAAQGPQTFTVSGTIRDAGGQPLSGVTLSATGRPDVTNALDGTFSIPLPAGWNGSLTPAKPGFTFLPIGRTYANLASIQTGQDFGGSQLAGQFVISGTVSTSAGAPIEGAVVQFSGLEPALTGADGVYNKTVRAGWSGQATPAMSGFRFLPESRSYTAISANQAAQDFPGSAVMGPVVSGAVTLVPTAGARSRMAYVPLRFTGTNGNPDYFVTTGVDGTFSTIVNTGWTGTITSGDPARCLLFPEARSITIPVTGPLSNQTLEAWVTPIGVPMPAFGIRQQSPPPPNPWTGAVAGWFYVNNTHPQSTDTDNPNGHPARPRRTIPRTLAAGSVVEVRGGPYAGFGYVQWSGTAQQPIFVRGIGSPRFTSDIALYNDGGGSGAVYTIFEGFNLFSLHIDRPSRNVAVRNCEVRGDLTDGGLTVTSYGTDPVSDIVLFNNVVHDNGDYQASFDQDVHGIEISQKAVNVWVLDNEMYRNSGDGIQINGGSDASIAQFHHIYVGRNRAHDNKQTGFWTKQAADVVFSENISHAHRPGNSSFGAGMGFQYSPANVWFLFNEIYDCEVGFGVSSGNTSNEGHYFVGNLVHDIHTTSTFNSDDAYHLGQAFVMWGTGTKYIVHNTIHDTDGGIGFVTGPSCVITDNIISGIRSATRHVLLPSSQTAGSSFMNHNLISGNVSIAWGGTAYSSLALFQAATGRGAGCANADPLFVSAGDGDFRLQPNSPGVNSGTAADVYATFLQRYGFDIGVDRDRRPRRLGSNPDMGCYER